MNESGLHDGNDEGVAHQQAVLPVKSIAVKRGRRQWGINDKSN